MGIRGCCKSPSYSVIICFDHVWLYIPGTTDAVDKKGHRVNGIAIRLVCHQLSLIDYLSTNSPLKHKKWTNTGTRIISSSHQHVPNILKKVILQGVTGSYFCHVKYLVFLTFTRVNCEKKNIFDATTLSYAGFDILVHTFREARLETNSEYHNSRAHDLFSCASYFFLSQCPPFRLSYQGLGEPLCFAAFGPFTTTAFYLLQSTTKELPITSTILSASLLVGITTSLILFCSHFHQINDDMAVGKISPLVRLGTKAGAEVVKVAVLSLYSASLVLCLGRTLPVTSLILFALTIPVGRLVVSFVEDNHADKAKIFMAKYYCVRLHAIYGAALAAGLVAARIMFTRHFVSRPILP